LLIKKAEATNQSTGNVVKDYEKQVIELKKALANSKPKSNVENIANSHAAQNVDYGKLDELKEEILLEKKRNVEVQQENEELNKLMNAFIQNKQKMEDMLKKKEEAITSLKQQLYALQKSKAETNSKSDLVKNMANKNNGIMKPLPKQIEDFQNLEKNESVPFYGG